MRFFASLILFLLISFSGFLPYGANAESNANISSYNEALDKIVERFVRLSKAGGLIELPKLPEEFYHNARIYELSGDVLNAKDAYRKFIDSGLEVMDPHQNYQQLLILSEGRTFVKEYYRDLSTKSNNLTVKFCYLQLLDRSDKISGLLELIADLSSFAPAYYELSREYSGDKLGGQGWTDKCKEKNALENFLRLVDEGHYYRYFVDKISAMKNVEEAKRRLPKLKDSACANEPVTCKQRVVFPQGAPSLELSCHFVEVPASLQLSKNAISKLSGSGTINFNDRDLFFRFEDLSEKIELKLVYTDVNHNNVGPLKVMLDPEVALINTMKYEYDKGRDLRELEDMLDGYEMYNVLISIINRNDVKEMMDFNK